MCLGATGAPKTTEVEYFPGMTKSYCNNIIPLTEMNPGFRPMAAAAR